MVSIVIAPGIALISPYLIRLPPLRDLQHRNSPLSQVYLIKGMKYLRASAVFVSHRTIPVIHLNALRE